MVGTNTKEDQASLTLASKVVPAKKKKSDYKAPNPNNLTSTQLRNARKRKTKQKKRLQEAGVLPIDDNHNDGENDDNNDENGNSKPGKKAKTKRNANTGSTKTTSSNSINMNDPSAQFLKNPKAAPIVQAAKRFFAEECGLADFPVYQNGPKIGWRTVSKLPVRQTTTTTTTTTAGGGTDSGTAKQKKQVVIGMYEPQSHQLLGGSKSNTHAQYPAHHPSINAATIVVALACKEMGIDVYDETTGNGYLRYIAMNVERSTGKVQLTLIWNDAPYDDELVAVKQQQQQQQQNNDGEEQKQQQQQPPVKLSANQKKRKRQKQNKQQQQQKQQDGDGGDPSSSSHHDKMAGKGQVERSHGDRMVGKGQLERLLSHLMRIASTATAPKEASKDDTTSSSSSSSNNKNKAAPQLLLHGLWVHYNASWKHSNAIFDIHSTSPKAWCHVCGPATIAEQLTLPPSPTSPTKSKSNKDKSKDKDKKKTKSKDAAEPATPVEEEKEVEQPPTLNFAPNVFRQANLDAFSHIITAIRQRVQQQYDQQKLPPSHKTSKKKNKNQQPLKCVELYGGVGTIGLHLLDLPSVGSLICSDENPHNRGCFAKSIASFPNAANAEKAQYVPLNASAMVTDERNFLRDSQHCNVLIVDPPRKGLDESVLEALVNNNSSIAGQNCKNIELFVYVSCGFDAFQRDYRRLTETKQWKLEHAEGHVLFPGSNAVETLAFFTPNNY